MGLRVEGMEFLLGQEEAINVFSAGAAAPPRPPVGDFIPQTRRYLRYRLGEATLLQLNSLAVVRRAALGSSYEQNAGFMY